LVLYKIEESGRMEDMRDYQDRIWINEMMGVELRQEVEE
jgi:hypothetical protein